MISFHRTFENIFLSIAQRLSSRNVSERIGYHFDVSMFMLNVYSFEQNPLI